jgi:hypothetical protein
METPQYKDMTVLCMYVITPSGYIDQESYSGPVHTPSSHSANRLGFAVQTVHGLKQRVQYLFLMLVCVCCQEFSKLLLTL